MRIHVRSLAPLALAVLVAAVAPRTASAQSVAGKWVLAVTLDAGSGDATFEFTVDGNAISGTYTGTLGEQTVTGTIEGNTVRFGFSVDQVGDVSYVGTIDGTSMKGTCEYGALGSGTFQGSKS